MDKMAMDPFSHHAIRLTLAAMTVATCIAPAAAQNILETAAFGGHVYHLLDRSTFEAAEADAIALGGHLATVDSAAENDFIIQTFGPIAAAAAPTAVASLWIGLNDLAEEGTFVWTSGNPILYTNWFTGEPAGTNEDENYAAIVASNIGGFNFPIGSWHDVVSDERFNEARFGVVELLPEPSSATILVGGAVVLLYRQRIRLRQVSATAIGAGRR